MEHALQIAELLLLVLLAVVQLGRWSQKTEDGPADAIRIAKEARTKADETANDLRRHRYAFQDYLARRYTELDKIYARKREVELELQTVTAKQDADCDRITAVERTLGRLTGV